MNASTLVLFDLGARLALRRRILNNGCTDRELWGIARIGSEVVPATAYTSRLMAEAIERRREAAIAAECAARGDGS